MRWVRRWIGVALIAIVLVAGWTLKAENAEPVVVSFVFGELQLELWEALLLSFGAGFAFAGSGWLWAGLRSSMTVRRYRKAVGALETELHQLRNLPLVSGEPSDARDEALARAVRLGG